MYVYIHIFGSTEKPLSEVSTPHCHRLCIHISKMTQDQNILNMYGYFPPHHSLIMQYNKNLHSFPIKQQKQSQVSADDMQTLHNVYEDLITCGFWYP